MFGRNKLSSAQRTMKPVQTVTSTSPAPSANPISPRVKNTNVEGDENYVPSKVQPVAPKSSVEYLPGPNGEKYPIGISRDRGPVMPSPEPTPEEIAKSKAKLAEKQRLNPGAVAPNLGQKETLMRAAMPQMQKTPMPASGPAPGQLSGQAPGIAQNPMDIPMGMKKGGSVRGAGIAQRGVKKCKVY